MLDHNRFENEKDEPSAMKRHGFFDDDPSDRFSDIEPISKSPK